MSEIPFRLVPGDEWRVSWLAADGERYTEPFFEDTVRRLRRRVENRGRALRTTPLAALAECDGPEPAAIIFHVSRCGSTLFAQMLAALPHHTVLAEAPLLDEILRLPRARPATTDAERIAWLRGAVAALARPHAGTSRRLFVKLDSWHIFELPLVRRAFPRTPLIFLHRHPVEVLASLMRMPSLTLVHDTVLPAQLGLTRAERDALRHEEHAAAALGAFFRAAHAHRAELHAVAYEQLPAFVWESLPGCAFNAAERAALAAAAQLDAKNPGEPFTPDSARKRAEATPELLAAADRWTLPAYRAFLAAAPAPSLTPGAERSGA